MTQPKLKPFEDNRLKLSEHHFNELTSDVQGFQLLSQLLKELAGINLTSNSKNYCLMASRLGPVMRERGIEKYRDFYQRVKSQNKSLELEFVHALTTNTTQFYREPQHFVYLTQVLPEILAAKRKSGNKQLRVWCAAASTGQEPYTMAMIINNAIEDQFDWDIKFLATDLDREVLAKAAAGQYSEAEVKGLPPQYGRYLRKVTGTKREFYQIDPRLVRMIRFAPLNLMTNPLPFEHSFDIIFCRNVLIYFEAKVAEDVVSRMSAALAPEGLLFLGHAEAGAMRAPNMKSVHHAVYKRTKAGK